MKLEEFRKITKPSKFRSEKSGGYDSKKEHKRAIWLKWMEKQNLISDLREQVTFELAPAQYVTSYSGRHVCVRRALKYIADFVYTEHGKSIVEDTKGFKTKEYLHKKRLMLLIYGIEIKET